MFVYSEKQLSKKLAVFSSIFVANTKIFFDYNFVPPLKEYTSTVTIQGSNQRRVIQIICVGTFLPGLFLFSQMKEKSLKPLF